MDRTEGARESGVGGMDNYLTIGEQKEKHLLESSRILRTGQANMCVCTV